jgi:uncharacterized protein (TIGR00299 family) protein
MTSVLYFDCFSGASGDMILGALLDLGVPLDGLQSALSGIVPHECRLSATRVLRSGISAVQFQVHAAGQSHAAGGHAAHRGLKEIQGMIGASNLSDAVKRRASDLFERLGRIEADIHQVPIDRVHFHEVGALDSIVDIVGSVWAMEALGVDRIVSSPLNTGTGSVQTAHGRLPIPAPATLRLLEGVPVYASDVQMELVTPTGALLVTSYASAYGPLPRMLVKRTGYGAGGRDIPGQANVLRMVLGDDAVDEEHGRVLVMECNIDDMSPQFFGGLMDRLFAAGALDVFFAAVQMKKNRPGTLVTVLAPLQLRETVLDLLFRETTTIGVRHHEMDRECLSREWVTVATTYGPVRIKVARRGAVVMNASPEYEDCAALATRHQAAVRDVHSAAVDAYLQQREGESRS